MNVVEIKSVGSVLITGEDWDMGTSGDQTRYWDNYEAKTQKGYDTVVRVEVWTDSNGNCLEVHAEADFSPLTGKDEDLDVRLPAQGPALSGAVREIKEMAGCI